MSNPEQHTAAFKIFHYPYYCRVRGIHLLTDVQLEMFGIVSSGNGRVDAAVSREWVDCQLTMADMAELFSEGVTIVLTEPERSVVMYEILREHLTDHLRNAEYAINLQKAPLEDLRKLEALASEIFKVARIYKPVNEIAKTGVLGKLSNLGASRPMARPISDRRQEEIKEQEQKLSENMDAPVAAAIARQFYKRNT